MNGDMNGDGDFTDAFGPNPTLTWNDLEGIGISDGNANTDGAEASRTMRTCESLTQAAWRRLRQT